MTYSQQFIQHLGYTNNHKSLSLPLSALSGMDIKKSLSVFLRLSETETSGISFYNIEYIDTSREDVLIFEGRSAVLGTRSKCYVRIGFDEHSPVSLLIVTRKAKRSLTDLVGSQILDNTDYDQHVTLASGMIQRPLAILSWNLLNFPDDQIHKINALEKQLDEDLDDYLPEYLESFPLSNGLQFIGSTLIAGDSGEDETENLADFWTPESTQKSTLPSSLQHVFSTNTNPDYIVLRIGTSVDWMAVDAYWSIESGNQLPAFAGMGDQLKMYSYGRSYNFHLGSNRNFSPFFTWLWQVKVGDQVLLFKANEIKEEPVTFEASLSSPAILGTGLDALHLLTDNDKEAPNGTIGTDTELLLTKFIFGFERRFALGLKLSTNLNLIPGEDELKLKSVEASIDHYFKPTASTIFEFSGEFEIFETTFKVRYIPNKSIDGRLASGSDIRIGDLIKKTLSIDDLPCHLDTLKIHETWLTYAFGTKNLSLGLVLTGEVDLIPNIIKLTSITFTREGTGLKGEGSIINLEATGKIEDVAVNIKAMYTFKIGWYFYAIANSETGMSLSHLADSLLHKMNSGLPSDIPNINLKEIDFSYQTYDRALSIGATTQWSIDDNIPVLGGEHEVKLRLNTARNTETGQNQTSFDINWDLKKPSADNPKYTLSAYTQLSSKTKNFGFSYHAPEDHPAELSDIVTELNLPSIPKPTAGVLDAIFQVSGLSMNYQSLNDTFDLAWTRPFPTVEEGTLLIEYSQQQLVAQGNDGGGKEKKIDVSWHGKDEKGTVGIDNILSLAGEPDLFNDFKNLLGDVGLSSIADEIQSFLTFKKLGFSWEDRPDNDILSFTAESVFRGGTDSFIAIETGEKDGLVAGICLGSTDNTESADTSHLPDFVKNSKGLSELLAAIKLILNHIELTHLIVSTVNSSHFQPPAYTASTLQPQYLPKSSKAPKWPFGQSTTSISQGLSIGARVKFGDNATLKKVLTFDELDGQVILGEFITLQIGIPKALSINAGSGNTFKIISPMLQLKLGEIGVEFDIMGGIDVQLFGNHLKFNGWLSLSEESIIGHIQIDDLPLPFPISPSMSMPGVQLVINDKHPLSLDVGLQFEPEGLDLGMSGSFAIYKNANDLVYGDAVFVLEMIEEIPNPLYVEFSLDEMSLPIWLEALTGIQYRLHLADKLAKDIEKVTKAVDKDGPDATKEAAQTAGAVVAKASMGIEFIEHTLGHIENIMSKVELTDVKMYWADSIVNLPDGTTAMPGVGLRGGLTIFDWKAFAFLDISAQGIPGITGHFEAEKIEIADVLKIWGDGKGLKKPPKSVSEMDNDAKIYNKQTDAKKSVKTTSHQSTTELQKWTVSKKETTKTDYGKWYLEPGGPVLHLSSRSSPFLHADLHAELFNFLRTDIHADINDNGFDFDFKIQAGNEVSTELECHWWHKEGRLEAHGDLSIHLHGDIGPIIPGISATKIHLDTDLDAHVTFLVDSTQFKFTVNGDFEFEGVSLSIPELVIDVKFSSIKDLAKAVWKHIEDEAREIFKEVILPIGELAEKAAKEVAKVATEAADDVAKVATEAAEKTKAIVEDTAKTCEEGVDAVKNAASTLANEAEDISMHAAEKALKAAAPLVNEAKEVEQQAVDVAKHAVVVIKGLVDDGVKALDAASHYVAQTFMQAEHWASQRLDEARQWVSARLDEAAAKVKQFAKDAEEMVKSIDKEIEAIGHEIDKLVSKISDLLKDVGHTISRGWHKFTSWF